MTTRTARKQTVYVCGVCGGRQADAAALSCVTCYRRRLGVRPRRPCADCAKPLDRKTKTGRCLECRYAHRRATAGRCPDCGAARPAGKFGRCAHCADRRRGPPPRCSGCRVAPVGRHSRSGLCVGFAGARRTGQYARVELIPDFCGAAKLPETPTEAPPGSPEKVAELCKRAEQRQALFHPGDAPGDPGVPDYARLMVISRGPRTATAGERRVRL